ncbi:MAG: MarR family transcriptional regulator [Pseudomonadota bacterium]
MSKLPDDVPDCMVFLLAKAYQKSHAHFKNQLKPYDLTNLQHLVLEGLWYSQGMTAAQLGKFLILDKATLSGVLDRMAMAGWIEKKPGLNDRRQLAIFTTSKADALKKSLIKERQKANETILKNFSLEERLLFKRLLIDVINSDE